MSTMSFPPTTVSVAARVLLLAAFLTGIAGVMQLVVPDLDADPVLAVVTLVLATALFMVSQRLSLGERSSWYAALAILGLALLLGLVGGSVVQVVVAGGALACLLSPSAWRFYTAPAGAGRGQPPA